MKGEQVLAELLSLLGLLLYGLILQHIYSEMLEHPERSWINQAKTWWVTRRSRQREIQLPRIWSMTETASEPEL